MKYDLPKDTWASGLILEFFLSIPGLQNTQKTPPARRDQILPFKQWGSSSPKTLCYLLYTAVTAYLSVSSLIKSSFFRTNWRGISSSSLNVFCRNEEKRNKHEITSWYFFITHSTKQMKGWSNLTICVPTLSARETISRLCFVLGPLRVFSANTKAERTSRRCSLYFLSEITLFLMTKRHRNPQKSYLSPKVIAYCFFPKLVDLS